MLNKKIVVLSLGGSLIAPPVGFNLKFLNGFKKLILDFIKTDYRFIIVCGGGATARNYQTAARELGELTAEDIDWIGIHATRLNAHFMRTIFRQWANPRVIKDPTKEIKWTEKILIGAGWKPGWSTDYDAVKLAELYGAKKVVNLSNIEYVYDKDPRQFPEAKKFTEMSWTEYRGIAGNKWDPGANWPFDPVASREAAKAGLEVIVMNGNNLPEAAKAIKGGKFKGTIIHQTIL
ncbi:MAG: UMP kinase [Candidatus Magasanikbacteria bacterium]|nr:UMP kinase [Candidatus Magasanikbacteria bacterium]